MPFLRRVTAIVLATAGIALCAATPASAATSEHWAFGAGYVWYNAGDHDLSHGPNSFTIQDFECDRFQVQVTYSWSGGSGRAIGKCDAELDVSVAPLGPTAHPLRWRVCRADVFIRLTACGSNVDDVVYAN